MVLSFFRKSPAGLDHIVASSVTMLGHARHSYDLATTALLSGADPSALAEDIRATDQLINSTEQDLRGELVVHITVQGPNDIGEVLGLILLLKKIERIGDQAKNIIDMVEAGISFAGDDDADRLGSERGTVSALFGDAAQILGESDADPSEFIDRANLLVASIQDDIDAFLRSDRPGHEVVPRAIYARYQKRIVANLVGVIRSATEPINRGDDNDDEFGDLDD